MISKFNLFIFLLSLLLLLGCFQTEKPKHSVTEIVNGKHSVKIPYNRTNNSSIFRANGGTDTTEEGAGGAPIGNGGDILIGEDGLVSADLVTKLYRKFTLPKYLSEFNFKEIPVVDNGSINLAKLAPEVYIHLNKLIDIAKNRSLGLVDLSFDEDDFEFYLSDKLSGKDIGEHLDDGLYKTTQVVDKEYESHVRVQAAYAHLVQEKINGRWENERKFIELKPILFQNVIEAKKSEDINKISKAISVASYLILHEILHFNKNLNLLQSAHPIISDFIKGIDLLYNLDQKQKNQIENSSIYQKSQFPSYENKAEFLSQAKKRTKNLDDVRIEEGAKELDDFRLSLNKLHEDELAILKKYELAARKISGEENSYEFFGKSESYLDLNKNSYSFSDKQVLDLNKCESENCLRFIDFKILKDKSKSFFDNSLSSLEYSHGLARFITPFGGGIVQLNIFFKPLSSTSTFSNQFASIYLNTKERLHGFMDDAHVDGRYSLEDPGIQNVIVNIKNKIVSTVNKFLLSESFQNNWVSINSQLESIVNISDLAIEEPSINFVRGEDKLLQLYSRVKSNIFYNFQGEILSTPGESYNKCTQNLFVNVNTSPFGHERLSQNRDDKPYYVINYSDGMEKKVFRSDYDILNTSNSMDCIGSSNYIINSKFRSLRGHQNLIINSNIQTLKFVYANLVLDSNVSETIENSSRNTIAASIIEKPIKGSNNFIFNSDLSLESSYQFASYIDDFPEWLSDGLYDSTTEESNMIDSIFVNNEESNTPELYKNAFLPLFNKYKFFIGDNNTISDSIIYSLDYIHDSEVFNIDLPVLPWEDPQYSYQNHAFKFDFLKYFGLNTSVNGLNLESKGIYGQLNLDVSGKLPLENSLIQEHKTRHDVFINWPIYSYRSFSGVVENKLEKFFVGFVEAENSSADCEHISNTIKSSMEAFWNQFSKGAFFLHNYFIKLNNMDDIYKDKAPGCKYVPVIKNINDFCKINMFSELYDGLLDANTQPEVYLNNESNIERVQDSMRTLSYACEQNSSNESGN